MIDKTLRQMREERGLTLRALEAETGINISQLSKFENGLNISPLAALRLAHFYGIPVATLYPDAIARRGA